MKGLLRFAILFLGPWLLGQEVAHQPSSAWLEDLEFLSHTLKTTHKNPFHLIAKSDFDTWVTELRLRIPELSYRQVLVEFTRLTAQIGDGHTALRPYKYLRTYPITLFWYGDTLRIHHLNQRHKNLLGYRVTAINGTPILKALEATRTMTPAGENEYYVRNWSQYWLRNADVLFTLGLATSDQTAEYTLENDEGEVVRLQLNALDQDSYQEYPWAYVFESPPAFMQPTASIHFRIIPGYQALYIGFSSYPEWAEVRRISREVATAAKAPGIQKLVVDYRRNGGGDFNKGLHLIKQLQRTEIQERVRVYVLTDRGTFSAAMSNAAHFRDRMGALLVGEPPAQRPNGYSETGAFTLPNSGVEGSCSLEYYTFQDQDTPELQLHKHIQPRFQAFLRGQDPTLEWVLTQ